MCTYVEQLTMHEVPPKSLQLLRTRQSSFRVDEISKAESLIPMNNSPENEKFREIICGKHGSGGPDVDRNIPLAVPCPRSDDKVHFVQRNKTILCLESDQRLAGKRYGHAQNIYITLTKTGQ